MSLSSCHLLPEPPGPDQRGVTGSGCVTDNDPAACLAAGSADCHVLCECSPHGHGLACPLGRLSQSVLRVLVSSAAHVKQCSQRTHLRGARGVPKPSRPCHERMLFMQDFINVPLPRPRLQPTDTELVAASLCGDASRPRKAAWDRWEQGSGEGRPVPWGTGKEVLGSAHLCPPTADAKSPCPSHVYTGGCEKHPWQETRPTVAAALQSSV